jgi:hypothetical protein
MLSHVVYIFLPIDHRKVYKVVNKKMNQDLQSALRELGPVPPLAGELGVLRVLVTYPTMCDVATIDKAVKDDELNHPGAAVDVKKLAWTVRKEDLLTALTARKRKRSNDTSQATDAKRPKH